MYVLRENRRFLRFVPGDACFRRTAEVYPVSAVKKLVTSQWVHVSAVRREIIPPARTQVHRTAQLFRTKKKKASSRKGMVLLRDV